MHRSAADYVLKEGGGEDDGRHGEEQPVRALLREQREHRDDNEVARERADLVDRVLVPEGRAAGARLRIAQGQGVLHAQLDVLAQGVDEDGEGDQDLGGGDDGEHPHAQEHDDRADLVEGLRGEHEEDGEDEHEQEARDLAEEFEEAPVELAHGHDLRKIVVDHALVDAVAEAGDEERSEEDAEGGVLPEDRGQSFAHSRSFL